jgi:hypothetical protein
VLIEAGEKFGRAILLPNNLDHTLPLAVRASAVIGATNIVLAKIRTFLAKILGGKRRLVARSPSEVRGPFPITVRANFVPGGKFDIFLVPVIVEKSYVNLHLTPH